MRTIQQIIKNNMMLTDGGLETTLIYEHGIDLPYFAAFTLIEQATLREILMDYYTPYLELAARYQTGFILESATYKANPETAFKLGYNQDEINRINREAIRQLSTLRDSYKSQIQPILISGCIGPRKDGYIIGDRMNIKEAADYHYHQINAFQEAGADLATAFTLNYEEEAIGIVEAARRVNMPVVISFTLETDGRLPNNNTLEYAIATVDKATGYYPEYYMVNCAHPSHFTNVVKESHICKKRLMAIRANASCKSHAELEQSTELDAGNKCELAGWYKQLKQNLPGLQIIGGCCGTDHSHMERIMENVMEKKRSA